jgi:drug/metabolite transporter (DMT)-like permease
MFSDDFIRIGSIVLGAFSMALYYVLQKPYLERYPLLTLTAWSYFFGAIWMALAQCYYLVTDTSERYHQRWQSMNNTPAMLTLLFAVLMNSVVKYALQSFSNKWTNATTLCIWSCLVPIFTGIVGAATPRSSSFHEPLTLAYLGALPVIVGVFLVTKAKQTDKVTDGYGPIDDRGSLSAASSSFSPSYSQRSSASKVRSR